MRAIVLRLPDNKARKLECIRVLHGVMSTTAIKKLVDKAIYAVKQERLAAAPAAPAAATTAPATVAAAKPTTVNATADAEADAPAPTDAAADASATAAATTSTVEMTESDRVWAPPQPRPATAAEVAVLFTLVLFPPYEELLQKQAMKEGTLDKKWKYTHASIHTPP